MQSVVGQYTIPNVPKKQTSVYDYINLLSNNERNSLERKLVRYSDSTSTQIVVAVISRTNGEDIPFLAARWAEKWGIGQKGKNNGILILVAEDDRKITIQTGYGVEHLLTDYTSSVIINQIITPQFKKGNFYLVTKKQSLKIEKQLFSGVSLLDIEQDTIFFNIGEIKLCRF